jgi:hypothetical protein
MRRVLYPKYTRNSNSSTVRKQIAQFKNRQRIQVDISQKKTYKWPTGILKQA